MHQNGALQALVDTELMKACLMEEGQASRLERMSFRVQGQDIPLKTNLVGSFNEALF